MKCDSLKSFLWPVRNKRFNFLLGLKRAKDALGCRPEILSLRNILVGIAILPFLAFAVNVFLSAFSKTDFLIGWDTPAYVYSVRILAKEGLFSFLKFMEYSRFPYSIALYFFYMLWPAGLFTVTEALPVLLAIASGFLVGLLLFIWFKDVIVAVLGLAFSYVWLAPYILASNLFSQLLTLCLGLFWLGYAFKPQTKRVQIFFYLIFLIASISHVYTMVFFYIVFMLSNLTTWIFSSNEEKENCSKIQIMTHCLILGLIIAFPLFFSTFLMNSTRVFGPLLNPQQIEETGILQISPSLLFASFGANLIFTIPISLVFVVANFVRSKELTKKLKYSFILWWTTVGLVLPFVSYAFPHLVSLTERMIIIMPIPLLAALFATNLSRILRRTAESRIKHSEISRAVCSTPFKGILLLILVISLFFANVGPIQDNARYYLKSFITQDTAHSLESLSQMPLSEKPLFILDASESVIADYAGLQDNIIGAYVGPHYTYVGPVQNLANLKRTVFSSKPGDIWSAKFFDQLTQSNILSYDDLANRSIILLSSLYTLRDYEKPYVLDFGGGVFFLDFEKLWENRSQLSDIVFLQAFSDISEKFGPWYGIKREWSTNPFVLELYSNVTGNEFSSYSFHVFENSSFSIKMRYFDFAGDHVPLNFCIDNVTVKQVRYNGTLKPEIMEMSTQLLYSGWHEISIRVATKGALMVNLDYILVEPK